EIAGRELGHRLREEGERLAGEEVHRDEGDLARLLRHGVGDLLHAVADRRHGRRAAGAVEIALALGVPEVDALAADDRRVRPLEVPVEHAGLDEGAGSVHGRPPGRGYHGSTARMRAGSSVSHSASGRSASTTISIFPLGSRRTRPGRPGASGITRASREMPSASVTAKISWISRKVTAWSTA